MKSIAAALSMSALVLLPLPASANAKSDIEALESHFASAFNASDVDAIMQSYAPDVFVFDAVPPRQYVGADAYRKDWQGLFSGFKGPVKFVLSDLDVTTAGTVAYGHSIQHLSGTNQKGKAVDLTVRVTDVYRKIGSKWLIVQEHVSFPVDLETGKPDMTSAP